MAVASTRGLVLAIAGILLGATQLAAQNTGTITGRVVDSSSSQPLAEATISVEGTMRRALTRGDGSFTVTDVPSGAHTIRVRRIGYGTASQVVNVTAGGRHTVDFALSAQAAALGEIVVTGYGTQRREAISGSVSAVSAERANVGVIVNPATMLQGRVSGVQMIRNNGEPGAGTQIRVRGGTSISASNEPLYVVDGVPLQNDEIAPGAAGIGSINAQLARSPLNSINPDDIESITVLKDASATAIYGSRGANGVILIQTKRVAGASGQMEYETYVASASPTKDLGLTSGQQYRTFVQGQVALYVADSLANVTPRRGLNPNALTSLGSANTDWEKEVTRRALTTNYNLAFSGGSQATQYRASLNYFSQQGIVNANGLQRYQGRLNATHDAFTGRLRLGLNMMAARVDNDYAPIENTGGFLGGLFTNMVIYNPTKPIRNADGTYYETGTGAQDLKNPVAMAAQWDDEAPENRILGNFTGTLSILENLTSQTTLGVDMTNAVRRTFAPRVSPVGAQYNGYARQAERSLQNANLQQLLTYSPRLGTDHEVEVVGGYEYTKFDNRGFEAQVQGFITDAFGVNNLGGGTQSQSPIPTSYRVESQLASFFGRVNYGWKGKYFVTGVVRQDGSSRLAEGHQWQTFPAVSASWRLSEEDFLKGSMFSTLALRAGWGKQGNQSVAPYQTKLLLRADPNAIYPFGGVMTTGLRAAQVGNPELTWETATQTNLGIDYGFANERFTGVIDFYQKTTDNLLLEVDVPQPAVVNTRLENIGSLKNTGVEITFNSPLLNRGTRTLNLELVASAERNEVVSLGDPQRTFINTGWVSGQGQSGQYSQRIMVGQPIGTFFAPRFVRVGTSADGANIGHQLFKCKATSAGCTNGLTTSPTDADREVIGSANPKFTFGLSNNGTWGSIDASWLWRAEFGGKVFNNTALVYRTKSNVTQGRNFLAAALSDPDSLSEPAKFSDRWIEDRTFFRLQNLTIGYSLPRHIVRGRAARVFVSGDNLLLVSGYSGYDPEVFVSTGLASRGIDYLTYPRARTFTLGARVQY